MLTTPQICLEGEGGCLRSPPPLQTTPPPYQGQQEEAVSQNVEKHPPLRSGFPAHHSNDAGDPKWLTARGFPRRRPQSRLFPCQLLCRASFAQMCFKRDFGRGRFPRPFNCFEGGANYRLHPIRCKVAAHQNRSRFCPLASIPILDPNACPDTQRHHNS